MNNSNQGYFSFVGNTIRQIPALVGNWVASLQAEILEQVIANTTPSRRIEPSPAFPHDDASNFFRNAVYKAAKPVIVYRGDSLDREELLSYQARQQKEAGIPNYLEITHAVVDEVYRDPKELDEVQQRHYRDSTNVFDGKKKHPGSIFVSVTSEKPKARHFATTEVTIDPTTGSLNILSRKGTLYTLRVPRGRLRWNEHNADTTGYREREALVAGSIPKKWIVDQEEIEPQAGGFQRGGTANSII